MVLVSSGDHNFLATNHVVSDLGWYLVLDASSTNTKVLYSCTSAQLNAYTTSYSLVATP
jgi:inulin fructotransferase (DFA-I-forming)